MAKIDNSERIERFIREQMTPEEERAFLDDLRRDQKLREEAQMMAFLIKEMKLDQSKQDAELVAAVRAAAESPTPRKVPLLRWVVSIAAIFLLLFGATRLWNRPSGDDLLFDSYYTSYEVSSQRSGDDGALIAELAALYDKVGTEKDLAPVIDRLQTIYDNIVANNEAYADYTYYENDVAWYLALAYVKDHQHDKAKQLLKPLAEKGDAQAAKLLKELEEK